MTGILTCTAGSSFVWQRLEMVAGGDYVSEEMPESADEALASSQAALALLRATVDGMMDPQVLVEAVRDPDGLVVDLVFRSVNRAACSFIGSLERDLLDRGVVSAFPNVSVSGLMGQVVECLDGTPVILEDFAYFSDVTKEHRRYDMRATQAGAELVVFTWRDVTERFQNGQRIAASEQQYRLVAENMRDFVAHIRDGRIVWASPSVKVVLGATQDYWIGREAREMVPPEDLPNSADHRAILMAGGIVQERVRVVAVDGVVHWVHLHANPFYDADGRQDGLVASLRLIDDEVAAEQAAEEARRQQAKAEDRYRLILENTADVVSHIRDGRVAWISPSVQDVTGAPPEYWRGREVREIIPPEDRAAFAARMATLLAGGLAKERVRLVSVDGLPHWVDLHAKPFYDADGRQDGWQSSFRLIDDEVAAEQALEEARRQQARADARYRRSIGNAAVGMCLTDTEGRFTDINDAMCQFFGYDGNTLTQMTFQELTAPEYLEVDRNRAHDILEGRIDAYRITKQYIHADGRRISGDLSVSCIRDENGQVESFIGQITDITALVEANELNRNLAQRLQQKSDEVTEELQTAATYIASILPRALTGKVSITSLYLPSRELGGDSFDYRWIDDDHLLIYLIDVSGHGIAPALLSVSLQNMLRFGNLAPANLLEPDTVLSELNHRFQMDQHGYHYFTMWCGVYEASSRTLRLASAGSPPALAFTSATGTTVAVDELSTASPPVGMFQDALFASRTYSVPPGCRLLVCSDGASEITLADNRQMRWVDFKDLTSRVAASPDWTLDELIDELNALTTSEPFEDDCSLIQLTFD